MYLHTKGITQIDLKAESIMIDDNNNLRLEDFWLPKSVNLNKTFRKPASVGTLFYIAPELIDAEE
jgi:serine/threonine protein kinase